MVTIDLGVVTAAVGLIGAAVGLIAALYRLMRRLERVEVQSARADDRTRALCKGVFACLDGLKQLGANGKVTEAHDMMRDHVIDD